MEAAGDQLTAPSLSKVTNTASPESHDTLQQEGFQQNHLSLFPEEEIQKDDGVRLNRGESLLKVFSSLNCASLNW